MRDQQNKNNYCCHSESSERISERHAKVAFHLKIYKEQTLFFTVTLFLKGIQGQGSLNESFLCSVLFLIFPFRAKNCMLQQMQTPNFMLFVSCKDVWTPKNVVVLYLSVLEERIFMDYQTQASRTCY